ncbi:MAG: glucose-6-phosphate isomerase [Solirubrobacterales bacterium]
MSDPTLTVEARIPGALKDAVAKQLARAWNEDVAGRVARGDATLWGGLESPPAPEIAGRLGWLTIAERMPGVLDDLEAFAEQISSERFADIVLLGMGGSSLAPEVLRRCFGHRPDRPALHVLDSTDAATIRAIEDTVELERTLFVVSSKSGGTIEPLSLFAHFWSLLEDGSRFVAITDPGSGLEKLAEEHGFRKVFMGDPNIGGRYSALSAFGIVPGALMGVDVRALLSGASSAWQTAISSAVGAGDSATPSEQTAAVWLGAALSALAQMGRDKLTFVVAESLPSIGLWLEQLVAESTGKHGTGILPVADEPLGDPDVYGDDRVFAYLPDVHAPNAGLDRKVRALSEAGHPVIILPTEGPTDLGRLFLLAELAVAVAGWGLQINPFDQPNVQQAKDATNGVLAEYESRHELPETPDAAQATLHSLLGEASPPDYVAIMGYVQPSAGFDAAVAELRVAIRQATKTTTTFGYGPRFLHSTGQFHKGGPKTGRFLQLLHDGPEDVEIPGKPYTFTTLKNAQATGDLDTLHTLERPAARVRLRGEDPVSALRTLTTKIKETL